MLVLTVNAGSTSVRLAAYELEDDDLHRAAYERHASAGLDPDTALRAFSARFDATRLAAVAHRVVHGGMRFTGPTRIEAAAEKELAALDELAPLHNPVARRWIAAARAALPARVAHVAVFDTAFFSRLPPRAAQYAIPASLGEPLGVRRYGFHGLAHEAMWERWCTLAPDLERGGRLVTLQLGGGASVAAIDRGAPLDTSMGFTPLEGLVMATRAGDIDAAVVPHLAARLGEPVGRVIERLNREAGLLGVSGRSSDLNELLDDPSPAARLAVEMYCTRARKYVGAYLALLGGCDGIVFGGGIGEHVPQAREAILRDMRWAGIVLDGGANAAARSGDARISADASRVRVWAVSVDEERRLARAAAALAG